jgi:hypothetical protein
MMQVQQSALPSGGRAPACAVLYGPPAFWEHWPWDRRTEKLRRRRTFHS